MLCPLVRFVRTALTLSLLAGMASISHGQAAKSGTEYPDSRFDIYGGYSYLHPLNSYINNYPYKPVSNPAGTLSLTGYFGRYFGVQVEGTYFSGNGEHHQYFPTCSDSRCDQLYYSVEAGPVLRYPLGPFIPFVHVLAGRARINGPVQQKFTWGDGLTGGLGFDYVLPYWGGLVAVRPIQADLLYSHVNYGPQGSTGVTGGVGDMLAMKLSGGLVLRFGEPSTRQNAMLGCTAEPVSVHAGDPVTITASTLYLNPHKKTTYTWTTNGGKLTPSGPTAAIDTTGMAPGQYTVNGHVDQGPRAYQQASCSAPFTVKAYEPPTLTCSANPATAPSGTTIMISTVGTSPDNRPLTYSYTTTAGQLTATGPTASLSTAGLGAMLINIGCNVVDDQGQSAKAATSVTITPPPVPVIPQTQGLCGVSFTRDRKRPVRVDNEAKGCLDDVALSLTQHSDSKLVIIGNTSPDEKPEAAAERAMNARQYLTQEKGIDASRIELRVGDTSGRTANDVLVPAGATFSDANTQQFDESAIHRHGQAYGTAHPATAPVHHHARRNIHQESTQVR
ncbi:MAG: hypothetical protein V4555_21580 [Acidobacteriota bacterium]